MKKILFATTALLATTSIAAADVTFSGYGRFGVAYKEDRKRTVKVQDALDVIGDATGLEDVKVVDQNGNDLGGEVLLDEGVTTRDTILASRFRLNIDVNAKTDGDVEFSARVRLQADEDSDTGEADKAGLNGARFSVVYGGLRVDVGNVSGAFDNLANYYGNEVGLELFVGQYAAVDYDITGYDSTGEGSNAVFFQYAIGDFAFGASYDRIDSTVVTFDTSAGRITDVSYNKGDRWAISTTYAFNNVTAGLAYGQTDKGGDLKKDTLAVLTLGMDLSDLNATVFVADDDVSDATKNGTAYGLSAAYNVGEALTLIAAYGDGSGDDDTQAYGIGATYDLGGGASLRGGIGRSKKGEASGVTQADFGAQFNF